MATAASFFEWVKATTVPAVIPKRPLVYVPSNASLVEVLEQLRAHKVHSLPVLHHSRKTVQGMVDVLDIVCSVYTLANLDSLRHDGNFSAGDVAAAFIDLAPLTAKLADTTAQAMIRRAAPPRCSVIASLPASFDGPAIPDFNITHGDTVYELMTKLGWDARHRVPVIAPMTPETAAATAPFEDTATSDSAYGEVPMEMVDLISQSDLIRFFAAHTDRLPTPVLAMPVGEITSKLLSKVTLMASMAEVLYLFKQRRVLSIVVEDNAGGFVGPVSANDFVDRAGDLSIFGMAVDEFLAPRLAEEKASATEKHIILPPTATVGEALAMLVDRHAYRFWTSDGTKSPTGRPIVQGVVSLRDIIQALWRTAPGNVGRQVCED